MTNLLYEWGLAGLFASAFVSSTILPGGSEAVLAVLQYNAAHPPLVLLLVATAGNTLGGMTSWLLGYLVAKRWSAADVLKTEHQRAVNWLEQHGSPLLLLSWLPVIGDPLCVAAGWLRMNVWLSAMFIMIGKAVRYAFILYVFG